MEVLTLLKEFGLPGVFIGILLYIVKFQEKANADRETRFSEERTRWQSRDTEWLGKVLNALQNNSDVMVKFATNLEHTLKLLTELSTLMHSNDAQAQAILEQLMKLDPSIVALSQLVHESINEFYKMRQQYESMEKMT